MQETLKDDIIKLEEVITLPCSLRSRCGHLVIEIKSCKTVFIKGEGFEVITVSTRRPNQLPPSPPTEITPKVPVKSPATVRPITETPIEGNEAGKRRVCSGEN